jgi:hypothetical protein
VVYSTVSDPDGSGSLVTSKMIKFFLGEVLASMNGVHAIRKM